MMNLQEKHWEKLFGNLTTEANPWHGIWTVYSPDQEIIRSSQGIRILQANEDKTAITHTNKFPLPDGSIQEKQWQMNKEACNQPDGLFHPADSSKRGIALAGYGSSAWVAKTLEIGSTFSVELFLKHDDCNTSIGSIYDQNGSLEKILHLREHLGSFPDIPAPAAIKELPGNWVGTKESITPDLKISEIEKITNLVLDTTLGKNQTFFLPDGVVVNIPEKLNVGEEFQIVAGKLVTENEYKRLPAKYNNSGAFALLISEVFHQEL